jgi:hypothetical protein
MGILLNLGISSIGYGKRHATKNACYYARANRGTRRFRHFRLASLRVCHTDQRLR